MTALPAYVLAHAGDASQVVPYLVEFPTQSWRWTTHGSALVALGYLWTNYPVEVTGLSAGNYDAASCSLKIADSIDFVAATDLATTKGLVGMPVNVYEAWLDPSTFALQATVQKFRGKVVDVALDLGTAIINCGPWVTFSRKDLPRWTASTSCRYVYRDSRCGYTGALATCNRSFDACTTHANTARFGGFRNLPKPNTKLILGGGVWKLEEPT